MKGTKPDPQKVEELRKKISSVVPQVVKAVEDRERLAAASRYRELEGLKKKNQSAATASSEDARKQP